LIVYYEHTMLLKWIAVNCGN